MVRRGPRERLRDSRREKCDIVFRKGRDDGRLTGDRIRAAILGWRKASIWFCGPAGFGEALRRDFANQGFKVAKRFHQELFAMR